MYHDNLDNVNDSGSTTSPRCFSGEGSYSSKVVNEYGSGRCQQRVTPAPSNNWLSRHDEQ